MDAGLQGCREAQETTPDDATVYPRAVKKTVTEILYTLYSIPRGEVALHRGLPA